MLRTVSISAAATYLLFGVTCAAGDGGVPEKRSLLSESKEVLSGHQNLFETVPRRTPADHSVDGPLLGNGDMGIAIGGPPQEQRFYLCKNDMWRLQHGYGNASPVSVGYLDVRIPGLAGASYRIEQELYPATTRGTFEQEGSSVSMLSYVAATENLLVLELKAQGTSFTGEARLHINSGRGSDSQAGCSNGTLWGYRAFTKDVDIPTGVSVACRAVGTPSPSAQEDAATLRLVVTPDEPVVLVLAMDSVFRSGQYRDAVRKAAADATRESLSRTRAEHERWWADYWAACFVDIDDPVIEGQYYRSQYGLGSCSRDIRFPPGIFGWVTTDRPQWHGDYHLNYNHMAPFYGLYSSNHIQQADPHDAPVLDFLERATWHCREIFGFEGAMYPVGIGPRGIETTYGNEGYIQRGKTFAENRGLFFGQRTNGSYALVNMALRWYYTYDEAYGRKIYPLVLQTATFWENYATWDAANQRYVIDKDSVHEGSGEDLNSCLSLGLVRNTLLLALDLSQALGLDPDRRAHWEHILKHLSGYTYQEIDGKTVFRYTEKGTAWWGDNTLGIQQIYPAGQIHLDSDPELLAVARNTISVMQRWRDHNGCNSFYPAAVRVGYDSDTILRKLRGYCEHTYSNGFTAGNPHGIENFSTVPNTINEMLCMSHLGVIRLFPAWPRSRDARFRNMRGWGAFLVSAELRNGTVRDVRILSEKGRPCTVVNPWPHRRVTLIRNGREAEELSGDRLSFDTQTDETIRLMATNEDGDG